MMPAVMRIGTIFSLLLCWWSASFGQSGDSKQVKLTSLSLEECLQIALENNLQIKLARNNALVAKSNDMQAIMNFLPSVNAFANYSFNNGTSFNNFSGQLQNTTFNNSFPFLTANLTIFNGLSNLNARRSTAKALEAQTIQIAAQKQNIRSNVLGAYLAVVLDKENLKIGQARIALMEAQLSRAESRHSVGVVNLEQVYNFRSQLANERLSQVNLRNQLKADQLTLIQLLQLPSSGVYDIQPYNFEGDEELMLKDQFGEILDESLAYSPGIKSAEANAESALYNQKAVMAGALPTVSLAGNYSTQYSSLNVDPDTNEEVSIREQYQNLTFKSLDLQVRIPLFNNGRVRNASQLARLNMENARLGVQQAELDVTNQLQQIYLNLVSAQETYRAAEENLKALNQTFEFVKTRYEAGNTDFYTYLESLNNKNRAEIQLVNAKYSIIFRKKILDVFRGLL